LRAWSIAKRLKFTREEAIEIGKGVATNGNGLGIELGLKNFKARLGEVKVMVRANKMACPKVEKSNFMCMNSRIISYLGIGDLDCKA
jgi:hypothetical protein